MRILGNNLICAGLVSFAVVAHAQHDGGGGYGFDIPSTRPVAVQHTPAVTFPISAIDAEAQTHVNAAMEYSHGFWTFEAERHMREVIARYPEHPMPYVLAAFIETIFGSGDFERGNAYFAAAKRKLDANTVALSEREHMWFHAIAALYDASLKTPQLQAAAHLERLEKLQVKYPDDLEAKSFLALANWLYKILDAKTTEADRAKLRGKTDMLIEDVISTVPTHPAHHYKIHLWNTGKDDFRALDSARASGPAQPRTAHLWHMPAHIFSGTYDHYFAMKQVEIAHRVDHKQMLERRIMPTQVHNYYHNYRDFGLRLTANSGQVREAVRLGATMLKFGRLEHQNSRGAMQTLATMMMQRLEQYEHWAYADELVQNGYYDLLDSGNILDDKLYTATMLHHRLRSMTHSSERFAETRDQVVPLLKQIERLSTEIGPGGEIGKQATAIFEDSRLWYEVAIRRPSGEVPEYYLTKMLALGLTPASQLMLLAQELGQEEFAANIANDLRVNAAKKSLADHLNLVSYYMNEQATYQSFAARYREPIETAERYATLAIKPPVTLEDLQGTQLARQNPNVVLRIIANAEALHRERLANPPAELKYLADINLDAMGPIDPQHYALPTYAGEDAAAVAAFASPQRGRYKAYVFAVGPSCELCNKQLLALNAAKARLDRLGIELTAITITGERAHEIPTLPDPDGTLHKKFGIWDQFSDQSLHGLVLIDADRKMLWNSASEHAVQDVTFLLNEFQRVIRLNQN